MPCAAPLLLIDELAQRPRVVALLSSEMARAARQQRSVGGRSAIIDLDRGSFLVFMFAFLRRFLPPRRARYRRRG